MYHVAYVCSDVTELWLRGVDFFYSNCNNSPHAVSLPYISLRTSPKHYTDFKFVTKWKLASDWYWYMQKPSVSGRKVGLVHPCLCVNSSELTKFPQGHYGVAVDWGLYSVFSFWYFFNTSLLHLIFCLLGVMNGHLIKVSFSYKYWKMLQTDNKNVPVHLFIMEMLYS